MLFSFVIFFCICCFFFLINNRFFVVFLCFSWYFINILFLNWKIAWRMKGRTKNICKHRQRLINGNRNWELLFVFPIKIQNSDWLQRATQGRRTSTKMKRLPIIYCWLYTFLIWLIYRKLFAEYSSCLKTLTRNVKILKTTWKMGKIKIRGSPLQRKLSEILFRKLLKMSFNLN